MRLSFSHEMTQATGLHGSEAAFQLLGRDLLPFWLRTMNCALSPKLHALCKPHTKVPTKVLPLLLNPQQNRSLCSVQTAAPSHNTSHGGGKAPAGLLLLHEKDTVTNVISGANEQRELKTRQKTTTNHATKNNNNKKKHVRE